MMNPIEHFIEDVQNTLPTVIVSMDPPSNPKGRWFVDFRLNKRDVVVEWQATEKYFGVTLSTGNLGYGEKADWVSQNYYKTFAKVLSLLAFGHE